ncbi:MAG: hypothetical protein D6767_00815 [Candidatus Hydrogenedentota bacterium]|nr:MAG: hypothetical protein D6767_00815 [Candidatus Hydrogenedentota bacterium]
MSEKIKSDYSELYHKRKILDPQKWYFKISTNVNYFTLGEDILSKLNQIESMFGGQPIEIPLIIFNTSFSMETEKKVQRASTYFFPTGNVNLGYLFGNHQLEFELGTAGLVPLKTIDVNTAMTLTENKDCSAAGADLNQCPLAKMGFVDRSTQKGQYDLTITMNEKVWLIAPAISYDYIFYRSPKWGRMSIGTTAGLMILSASQKIQFSAKRTDLNINQAHEPDVNYSDRIMEGSAESLAVNDIGPIFRLYGAIRKSYKGFQFDFKLGFNYGWVYLDRDVDGTGAAIMGDTIAATFPTTALGFQSHENNKFELLGFFVQVGMVF